LLRPIATISLTSRSSATGSIDNSPVADVASLSLDRVAEDVRVNAMPDRHCGRYVQRHLRCRNHLEVVSNQTFVAGYARGWTIGVT
jgi:hypothetical protein